jgi:metacaspase-1
MAEGFSLHLGLNRLDASHYAGFAGSGEGRWEGSLAGCEQDAIDLEAITQAQEFTAATLLGDAATVQAVTDAVEERAASLTEGDLFVLTFSGYGGEVPDKNSDQQWRERTWALYDRQMPEDELISLLASFRPNVRLLVLDDSSVSGTVRRDVLSFVDLPLDDDAPRTRALPPDVASETYRSHSRLYDEIQGSHASGEEAAIPAAVVIISGCAEGQLAEDGSPNGFFTEALLRVWDNGGFSGDYRAFVREITARLPPTQSPVLAQRGSGKPFVRQRPFSL